MLPAPASKASTVPSRLSSPLATALESASAISRLGYDNDLPTGLLSDVLDLAGVHFIYTTRGLALKPSPELITPSSQACSSFSSHSNRIQTAFSTAFEALCGLPPAAPLAL